MPDRHLVFVYGTLRAGERLNPLLRKGGASFISAGQISGFEMLHLGAFPGIVPGEGTIQGEIYEVSDVLLDTLDGVEGYRPKSPEMGLYRRERVEVVGLEQTYETWTYIYNLRAGAIFQHQKRQSIPSGDWVKDKNFSDEEW